MISMNFMISEKIYNKGANMKRTHKRNKVDMEKICERLGKIYETYPNIMDVTIELSNIESKFTVWFWRTTPDGEAEKDFDEVVYSEVENNIEEDDIILAHKKQEKESIMTCKKKNCNNIVPHGDNGSKRKYCDEHKSTKKNRGTLKNLNMIKCETPDCIVPIVQEHTGRPRRFCRMCRPPREVKPTPTTLIHDPKKEEVLNLTKVSDYDKVDIIVMGSIFIITFTLMMLVTLGQINGI